MLDIISAIQTASTAQSSSDRWLDLFTGALVLVTGALGWVAFLQYKAMGRQEEWMRRNVEIAKQSADAAMNSADAAIAAVKQMKENARKQLRARVFVAGASRIGPCNPGSFSAEMTIKNFGNIPAYYCTFEMGIIFMPNPLTETIPDVRKTGQEPNMVLAPGAEVKTTASLYVGTFQNTQHSQVMSGDHAVYIHGTIRYKDGFGRKRYSTFLLKCVGADYSSGRFSFCETGNKGN